VAGRGLLLAVIDSLKPAMLEHAIEDGRAPALAALMERGSYVADCVSSFPSVTPVASATIATGTGPAEHRIPSMNWYHRGEERYVEYGSSMAATRAFGVFRSLYDTVYNMNMAHLSRAHETVFERLDDAGLRTACTTYLIYRGRHRHEPWGEARLRRLAEAAQFRHAVWGPREFFYADLFDSRNTGCTSNLGRPGQRDRHTGCVGAYLVEHDLFDFLLFSLPDNDTWSHRYGPDGQLRSIAEADREIERVIHVAGGVDAFLERYAVVVVSDHSQTAVDQRVNLADALQSWRVLGPADPMPDEAEVAVCPAARSAMVYALDDEPRERAVQKIAHGLRRVEGVELTAHRVGGEAVVWSERGELRFAPGGDLSDRRSGTWSVEGELTALELSVEDGVIGSDRYPDALGRLWSALDCDAAGDVLVSATPGYEFVDWGGAAHVPGGSHGSLEADDSLGVLLTCGVDLPERDQWSIADLTRLILDHFSVSS
jgi:type I phosphodiesterase/nucleotide pyrophosphatase